MKKHIFTLANGLLMIAALSLFMTACKSKKVSPSQMGEREIVTYCSGPEYQSDNKTFRASALGESQGQMVAKQKAMTNARAELAAAINTTIKTVTDNYVKSGTYNNKEELMENYEGLTREVVNQTLTGTKTICERTTMTQQGTYKTYVCIELGSEELLQSLNQRLTTEEQLKIDYNYEKFKKTFEEEMSKM